MGNQSSKKKDIVLNIITPFKYKFSFDSSFNYNREKYYKFIAKRDFPINNYSNCSILLNIENNVFVSENISLDMSDYKEIVKESARYYEIEYHQEKAVIYFRINSINLTLKECVVKFC